MSSTLIFGASGAIGRFVLPGVEPGEIVRAVSRRPHPGWVCGDLSDARASWPDAQTVISLGPLDAFARWLNRHAAAGLRRVVAVSSMSAQSKRDSADPDERALAQRLLDAEALLKQTADARAIAWTILRPTLIYGAGTDRSLAPLARFAQRWRVLPIPLGANGLRQPIHARDLAAAVLAVRKEPVTFGKTYELGGAERLRFDAMLWRLLRATPGFVLPLPIPRSALRLLPASMVSRGALSRLRQEQVADNAHARDDFGYAPGAFAANDVLPECKAPSV